MKPTKFPMFRATALTGTLLISMALSAGAAERTFRYYQYKANVLRNNSAIQLSEFQFSRTGTNLSLSGVTVTNPGGSNAVEANEGVRKLIDNTVDTKWYDGNNAAVVFDFGSAVTIDAYTFATANDDASRDPLSWTLSGSTDGVTWSIIDKRSYYPTTADRKVFLPSLALPTGPIISEFAPLQSIVENGEQVALTWNVSLATSITIDQGIGTVDPVSATGFVPPENADTTYTLTATGPEGTATATATVRSVPGTTVNYRYIRYIPRKLRNNSFAVGVQLAEFSFSNGGALVQPVAIENIEPFNTPTAESAAQLIDNNINTKWLNFAKTGVIFDFGAAAPSIKSYDFVTANDDISRDPVRWTMEGSNDKLTWTLIDNVTAFDYSTKIGRREANNAMIQFPGAALPPYLTFVGDTVAVSGGGLALSWNVAGAQSLVLSNGPTVSPVDGAGSTIVVPTANTDYTLTATSAGGKTTAVTIPVQVITPPVQTISYTNFEQAGAELALLGNGTSILNAFPTITQPGDFKRLRLTPAQNDRRGIAWFRKRVSVGSGFEATFGLHVLGTVGADGAAFVIQNTPEGTLAQPATLHEQGLPTKALNISFDGFLNAGEPGAAVLRVLAGAQVLSTVDLSTVPGITVGFAENLARLAKSDNTVAPYQVRVTYVPGDLDVYVDGVQVVSNLNVDLAAIGAISSDGLAWAGFTARTGGLSEVHDITSWNLGNYTPPAQAAALKLVSYTINRTASEVTLTWESEANVNYRITASDNLTNWSTVLGGTVVGSAGTTTTTRTFTGTDRLFFRVEKQ